MFCVHIIIIPKVYLYKNFEKGPSSSTLPYTLVADKKSQNSPQKKRIRAVGSRLEKFWPIDSPLFGYRLIVSAPMTNHRIFTVCPLSLSLWISRNFGSLSLYAFLRIIICRRIFLLKFRASCLRRRRIKPRFWAIDFSRYTIQHQCMLILIKFTFYSCIINKRKIITTLCYIVRQNVRLFPLQSLFQLNQVHTSDPRAHTQASSVSS